VTLNNSIIFATTISNVSFQNSRIMNLTLFENIVQNCEFTNAHIYKWDLLTVDFDSVTFKKCVINRVEIPFKEDCSGRNLFFEDVEFDKGSYTLFAKKEFSSVFKNCRFSNERTGEKIQIKDSSIN
jgi:uncharacterized protein YjbI with pentapeptide repeats